MKVKIYQNKALFLKDSLNFVEECCKKKKGKLHVALSGGSTPKPLYEAIAKKKNLPWKSIEWFQVDERYVPENHRESNARMIRESLKKGIGKKFHTFDTKLPLAASLKKYETELKGKWTFDLMILGIGTDGHIASLFPGALKTKRLVAHTQTKTHAIRDRLTITFPVILRSKKILILLAGKEKESVLKELQHGSKREFPAKKLLKHKNLQLHFLRR